MKRGLKIKKITKANYGAVCERAAALEKKLKACIDKGEFPSIHFMSQSWGFNLSDAALERHRKRVLKELGVKKTPKATLTIPRKRKKAPAKAKVRAKAKAKAKA